MVKCGDDGSQPYPKCFLILFSRVESRLAEGRGEGNELATTLKPFGRSVANKTRNALCNLELVQC